MEVPFSPHPPPIYIIPCVQYYLSTRLNIFLMVQSFKLAYYICKFGSERNSRYH